MKIKTKRMLMMIFLIVGIAWDCLCMLHTIPLTFFVFSAILIGGYSLIIVFLPMLFPALTRADEKSAYYPELTQKEKQASCLMIFLIIIWMITLAACVVYSL